MPGEEERDLYVRVRNLGFQVWYLDYMMSSHYDFKSRGFSYILFSPISVCILLPLCKYLTSKFIFDYFFVYRYLLPQLLIDLFTIFALIILSKKLLLISFFLQIFSLISYCLLNRKGYWLLWKSSFLNIYRLYFLLNKRVVYSHSKKP